jgi:tetratricopeptide (TPR) repeat protein
LGWKAIGQYLGCTERTARRWEADRAMPVHRVPGRSRSSVWASPDELARWLTSLPVAVQADIRSEARAVAQQSQELDAVADSFSNRGPEDSPLGDAAATLAAPAPVAASPVMAGAGNATLPAGSRRWPWVVGVCSVLFLAAGSVWLRSHGLHGSFAGGAVTATPYDDDPTAREEYRNARFELATRSAASLESAKAAFRHLTDRYPERAAGWSGLADTYLLAREFGSTSEADAYAAAAHAARTAIGLDPKSADAWLEIGFVDFWWNGDTEPGLKELQTGVQLNPDLARGWLWYGNALAATRQFDEALRALARARALDPESRAVIADESWTLFMAGRRDAALATMERLARIDPKFVSWHAYLQRCYLVLGRDEEFLREALATAELRGNTGAAARLAKVAEKYRSGGRAAMLDQLTADAIASYQNGAGSAVTVAAYRAQAKDRAGTLQWLRLAAAQHDHGLIDVPAGPEFEGYLDDPAVRQLFAFKR